jgi:hypothetical protein
VGLADEAVLKSLKTTDEQRKQLKELRRRYGKDMREFQRSQQGKPDREMKAYVAWNRQQKDSLRKEVEKVLTPEQVKAAREIELRWSCYGLGMRPKVAEALDMTKEQKSRIQEIQRGMEQELSARVAENRERLRVEAMAVLSPEQRAKLPEVALDPDIMPVRLLLCGPATEGAEKYTIPSIHPYPDLSDAAVQKTLGLSDAQRNRMRETLGKSATLADRLKEEALRLPPEQRKKLQPDDSSWGAYGSGDFVPYTPKEQKKREKFEDALQKQRKEQRAREEQNPLWNVSVQLRKQLEAVLTPEQLAAYRETAVRNLGPDVLHDLLVAKSIGLDETQRATLDRLVRKLEEALSSLVREMGGRMLDVLTPEQKAKLLGVIEKIQAEEMDRQLERYESKASAGGAGS